MNQKNFKDVVIVDNGRDVKVRIMKMDCISAQEWLIKFAVLLLNAGVPMPKKIATSVEELGEMVLAAVDSGSIFRMPGLTFGAVKELLSDLHKWAYFIVDGDGGNPKLLPAPEALKGQFSSIMSVFKLEAEVVIASLGFSANAEDLKSKIAQSFSAPSTTQTSSRLSEPL